ncbi:helix-turn-helix domain-containing protein [Vibrio sp. HN007]|uniref:AraC family transcriptional regulator n=1 Tax=Vibrio iocasae TaxID=3098914 RepID=UPI0035D50F75
MKQAKKFTVFPIWFEFLEEIGVNPEQVVAYAQLPPDKLLHEITTITYEESIRLCEAIEFVANGKPVPLLMAKDTDSTEFYPDWFAFLCCKDLNEALTRYSEYIAMISPTRVYVQHLPESTSIEYSCEGKNGPLTVHALNVLLDMVFLVVMARDASHARMRVQSVELKELPEQIGAYETFFGTKLIKSSRNRIRFTARDAKLPFLSDKAEIWRFFEPEFSFLNVALPNTTEDRLTRILLRALPTGQHSIELAAKRLALSKRTLQRKLKDEGLTYVTVLNNVRMRLASHYLRMTQLTAYDVAFLLGFNDENSFYRAFMRWYGETPENYRQLRVA